MRLHHNLTALGLCLVLCQPFAATAQADWTRQAKVIKTSSAHTAFPDEKRAAGYTYDGKFYDGSHYSDSSILLVVPKGLRRQDKVDLVFWFHGWQNNIDSANAYFHLAEQFIQSGKKAVLVLAETGKNVSDSYGGKLEQPDVFAGLVSDIATVLKKEKIMSKKGKAGNIVLAGHSGAYRIIAFMLQNGGVPVQEVLLFDALYGQVDKYTSWIQKDSANRFVHWYTSLGGGTDEVSVQMMDGLKKINIPFIAAEETAVTPADIHNNRIVFVHTARKHNDVIFNPNSFQLLLSHRMTDSGDK